MEAKSRIHTGIPDACILVAGQPRSGTTLISSVLRSTPGHLQAFEIHLRKPSFVTGLDGRYTRNIMRQVGLPAQDYDEVLAATDVTDMNLGAWSGPAEDVSAEPLTGRETHRFEPELRARGQLLSVLMRSAAHRTGATTWGFKILGDVVHMETYSAVWPNARVLLVVRDPRDQISSLLAMNEARQARGQLPFYPDVESAAAGWANTYRVGMDALKRTATDHMVVRYEDFVSDPTGTALRIGGWLELPVTEGLDFQDSAFVMSHKARFSHHQQLDQPITPSSVGRWQSRLTEDEASAIARIAGELMHRMGYS